MKITLLLISIYTFLNSFVYSQQQIIGIWELTYVEPTDMMDSDPRGITNVRVYFTPEGKLYSIMPYQTISDNIESVDFNVKDDTLFILPEGEEPIAINIHFTDSTLTFNSDMASIRIFKRINDPDNIKKTIEPKSLQLVSVGDSPLEQEYLKYDNSDYSSTLLNERILGVWETLKYEDVPNGEMPPYGFPNDIWIVRKNELEVIHRADMDTSFVKYKLSDKEIFLTSPDESIFPWKISFNQWGHMILDSGSGKMIFKLVTKDTQKIPQIPLKIVLLKMSGEE